jgi:hypothetical protein
VSDSELEEEIEEPVLEEIGNDETNDSEAWWDSEAVDSDYGYKLGEIFMLFFIFTKVIDY